MKNLRIALAVQGNQVEDMSLSIVNKKEGKKYELGPSDLKAYDVKTGPFKVTYPLITYAIGTRKERYMAVSHGFWAFLGHTVTAKGRI